MNQHQLMKKIIGNWNSIILLLYRLKHTNSFGKQIGIHDKTLDIMQQILDSQWNSRKLSKDVDNNEFSQMNIKINHFSETPSSAFIQSPASWIVWTTMSNDNYEDMKQNLHNEILSLNL